ncbi:MAG: hypothetical protein M3P50_07550 [Actinomycetota bacterium]|nr:hypothetical protein [Actinomycetota bacterium]
MNGRKTLIAATLGEVGLLVAVLAGYLIAIAARLRSVSATLGKITFGVRAIETQTAPIGPRLRDINGALEGVAAALQDVVGAPQAGEAAGDGAGIDSADDLQKPSTP